MKKIFIRWLASMTLFLPLMTFAHGTAVTKVFTDEHSYSNLQQVRSTHVALDLVVDFEQQQLKGHIVHQLAFVNGHSNALTLDTRDLDIQQTFAQVNGQWLVTPFVLAPRDEVLGSKLTITLPKGSTAVKVDYHSRPEASGLQWLAPALTSGKKLPFMFSQSQAIHARSWMPIQDTPAMRVTYSAKIKTPKNLRAVMSADNNPQWSATGEYEFSMPQAISPYLIAIAVGNIHHQKMSKQTAVYAEPEILAAAAKEFEDTQAMIETTEKLFGPYRWGQYDLLILPPSFPFGGMENPRLSFITPTVIAGDKSLVSLIAHELAHSWSGNLVTNATWRDLWLNEGFTSYVENRIMEEVYGVEAAVMEQALAYKGMVDEFKLLEPADTILYIALNGRNPDDAFSSAPYTKGQMFLMFLEQRFGRTAFDGFLRGYFDDHAFASIDSSGFVSYITAELINKHPTKMTLDELNTWIYQPGIPATMPNPQSPAFAQVKQHLDSWLSGAKPLSALPTAKWSTHEWLHFINSLPPSIQLDQLKTLDQAFNLTQSKNYEIAHVWLLRGINSGYKAVDERLSQYLIAIGRNRLIKPLYKALLQQNRKGFAEQIYQQARGGYHPLSQVAVEKIFAQFSEGNQTEDKKAEDNQ